MSKTTVEIIGKETLSDAAKKASSASKQLSDSTGGLIKNFTDLTAAGLVVGKVIHEIAQFAMESYQAFAEQEKAIVGWNAAMENAPSITRGAASGLRDFAESMAKLSGADDEAVLGMESFLAMTGRTPAEIEKVISAAADMAVVTGDDLRTAVEKLNATYSGTAGRLDRLVPALGDLTKEELESGAAVDLLSRQFDGLAEAMGGTADVGLKNLKNGWDDLRAAMGGMVEPVFNPMISALGDLFQGWADNIAKANEYRDALEHIGDLDKRRSLQAKITKSEYELEDQRNLLGLKLRQAFPGGPSPEQVVPGPNGELSSYAQFLASSPEQQKILSMQNDVDTLRGELKALEGTIATRRPLVIAGSAKGSEQDNDILTRLAEGAMMGSKWAQPDRDALTRLTEDAMMGAKWSGAGIDREGNASRRRDNEIFSADTVVRGEALFGILQTINGEIQTTGTVWDGIVESMGFANLSAEQMKMKLSDIGASVMQGIFDNVTQIADAMRGGASAQEAFADSLDGLINQLLKALPMLAVQAGFQLIGSGHWKEGLVLVAAGGVAGIVDAFVEFPWEKRLAEKKQGAAGSSSTTRGSTANYEKPRDITVNIQLNTPALVGEGGFRDFCLSVKRELQSTGTLGLA